MLSGFLNVLKPPGMTSHNVVSRLRHVFGIKKIGHIGTLDPAASGVLPVALGKSTRLIEYLDQDVKGYRAEIHFGIKTDTFDASGEIISVAEINKQAFSDIEETFKTFIGKINQKPPLASSIRIKGRHLYEYFRKGEKIEPPDRSVRIDSIRIAYINLPYILIDVICGAGTYIRSLCNDIGDLIGCGAHMSFLVRFQSGAFHIDDSFTIEEISSHVFVGTVSKLLTPPGNALKNIPEISLTDEQVNKISKGMNIEYNIADIDINSIVLLQSHNKDIIAIGKILKDDNSIIKPLKVFV